MVVIILWGLDTFHCLLDSLSYSLSMSANHFHSTLMPEIFIMKYTWTQFHIT